MFTNRNNKMSLVGGLGNSTHLYSQMDKSKDSNFDQLFEKKL